MQFHYGEKLRALTVRLEDQILPLILNIRRNLLQTEDGLSILNLRTSHDKVTRDQIKNITTKVCSCKVP
jgi:hypothetical protein